MKRREFITLLGGAAAAWPLAARAQQPAMPVVGFLSNIRPNAPLIAAFRAGLAEAGYVEGRNVKVEYRWANTQEKQLPALAADLVGLRVALIVAFGSAAAAIAAKKATSTIPIVIVGGTDPVTYGLVGSLNQPGGNVTGVTLIMVELSGKRVELLHDMVPQAATVAYLSGGSKTLMFKEEVSNIRAAADALGLQVVVLEASRDEEIEAAFAILVQRGGGALIVGVAPYLAYSRDKICQAVPVRTDYTAGEVRRFARRAKDGAQARRLLALAAVLDGASREEAAKIGGMDRQTLRDWVIHEQGPDGLINIPSPGAPPKLDDTQKAFLRRIVEEGPIPAIHGVVRWRANDLIMRLHEEFGLSVSDDTIYRALKDLGFSHVSARPKAYKQDADAMAAFKKNFALRVAEIRATLPPGTPVEVWFQDEMRVGQENKLTYRWARKGSRPRAMFEFLNLIRIRC